MADTAIRVIPPEETMAIIDRYRDVDPMEAMIPILQEVQVKYGFVTEAVVNQMAQELGISTTEIYGVVTFYSFFRFNPAGGRTLLTCEGTSCYVRGAAKLRETLEDRLGVVAEETTPDQKLTFVPMAVCMGACDLGPLVEMDGHYYSHVTPDKLNTLLDEWLAKPAGEVAHGGGPGMGPYGFGPTAEELGSMLPVTAAAPTTPRRTGLRTRGTRT
ncbi:MAG TPA: NAD(P)H-dependent oxidoreductase subunit E [Chloroflexia bacterium]|nr:NAD(P)H-dependent oxidoreductase subunit E [Chloroflexia bacterium]